MYYNPDTDKALLSLEQHANNNRKIIERLNPPIPKEIVWSVAEGRWIKNSQFV